MAQHFEINAQTRSAHGKSNSRRLRRLDGRVPAVVYGAGKEPLSLSLSHSEMIHSLQNEAFYSHILTLKCDGKAEKVVLKSVQRHPYKPEIVHVDLLRVNAKEKLHMHIPLHFTNEETAPGVKAGGIVSHHLAEVEVSCLPADLPEFIEVDLSKLEMDGSIHLSALKLPKGVELVALSHGESHDTSVVSIHAPRVQEEPETPTTEIIGEAEAAAGEATDAASSSESDTSSDSSKAE